MVLQLNELFAFNEFNFDQLFSWSCLKPVPVQMSRFSVWVGGFWPNKAPLRRAARWDGMFAIFPDDRNRDVETELEHLKAAIAYVREHRQESQPFDVIYAGRPTSADDPTQTANIVGQYATAGVTWWLENITPMSFGKDMDGEWPLEAMHHRILQGPPQV